MMSILFPHLGEDVEFLLPAEEDVDMGDPVAAASSAGATGTSSFAAAASLFRSSRIHENAVAGPSRLGGI
ncbi:hypothetical protein V8E53_005596 [Lactarius tabidus]|jgi:hypothetical protein